MVDEITQADKRSGVVLKEALKQAKAIISSDLPDMIKVLALKELTCSAKYKSEECFEQSTKKMLESA